MHFQGLLLNNTLHFLRVKSKNITSRVTTKQYCKQYFSISFYQTKLTFWESYCQIIQTIFIEDVPDNNSYSLRCEVSLKPLLVGLSAKSTSQKVFDFKKLEMIYCWDTYHFFVMITSTCISQIALPTRNELAVPANVACEVIRWLCWLFRLRCMW